MGADVLLQCAKEGEKSLAEVDMTLGFFQMKHDQVVHKVSTMKCDCGS